MEINVVISINSRYNRLFDSGTFFFYIQKYYKSIQRNPVENDNFNFKLG